MGSVGWSLIQYDWDPYRKGTFACRLKCIKRDKMETQREDSHLCTKERGLEQPSEGTNPAPTSILDFWSWEPRQ